MQENFALLKLYGQILQCLPRLFAAIVDAYRTVALLAAVCNVSGNSIESMAACSAVAESYTV